MTDMAATFTHIAESIALQGPLLPASARAALTGDAAALASAVAALDPRVTRKIETVQEQGPRLGALADLIRALPSIEGYPCAIQPMDPTWGRVDLSVDGATIAWMEVQAIHVQKAPWTGETARGLAVVCADMLK
jgi:hypothetical protein